MRRVPSIVWATLIFGASYTFFAYGIAPLTGVVTGTSAPLPSSLVMMYTGMVGVAILLYFSVREDCWRAFIQPIIDFLRDPRPPSPAKRRARGGVLVLIPLVVGARAYVRDTARPEPPADPPGIHFSLPNQYIATENPLPWAEENIREGGVLYAKNCAICHVGAGRKTYTTRCYSCHGERGQGDGAAAAGMIPRPRDFILADYKIRSTPYGQLPTDEDLFRVISRGLPGTPMLGWENILTEKAIRDLVAYVKLLSPRFAKEAREPIGPPPGSPGSVQRGAEVYRRARCFMCHGEAGRGDGGITTALDFQWGMPYAARDFTRGWTFKGGHEPRDIYLRITGGMDGTPMGPYRDLLSDQERWDLAHYVASLDREPSETSDDFVVAALHINGEIPSSYDAAPWQKVRPVLAPLAGQIELNPPRRSWIPTVGSATVRALWNGAEVGFLLEWNDPTGPDDPFPDSALVQFAALDGSKPYFLYGDRDNPVTVWQWHAADTVEEWSAAGSEKISARLARFRVHASWSEGRWHVIFQRALAGEPRFEPGSFVPTLFSVRDGANGEFGNTRAISTWLYATLERPPSARSWLLTLAYVLGTVVVELWILSTLRS